MPSATSIPERGLAALWGFAEATVFFIVPDVVVTKVATEKGARAAVEMAAYATGGALAGGALAYLQGRRGAGRAWRLYRRLPAIDDAMITAVRRQVAERGPVALILGPMAARPYKLYAVAAGEAGQSLPAFLTYSVPGRATRFLLAGLGCAVARRLGDHITTPRSRTVLWSVSWIGIYALLWRRRPATQDRLT